MLLLLQLQLQMMISHLLQLLLLLQLLFLLLFPLSQLLPLLLLLGLVPAAAVAVGVGVVVVDELLNPAPVVVVRGLRVLGAGQARVPRSGFRIIITILKFFKLFFFEVSFSSGQLFTTT